MLIELKLSFLKHHRRLSLKLLFTSRVCCGRACQPCRVRLHSALPLSFSCTFARRRPRHRFRPRHFCIRTSSISSNSSNSSTLHSLRPLRLLPLLNLLYVFMRFSLFNFFILFKLFSRSSYYSATTSRTVLLIIRHHKSAHSSAHKHAQTTQPIQPQYDLTLTPQ